MSYAYCYCYVDNNVTIAYEDICYALLGTLKGALTYDKISFAYAIEILYYIMSYAIYS